MGWRCARSDIDASAWDNGLEPDGRGGLALRLGFRQIKGMREEEAVWIEAARGNGYRDVGAVWRRAGVAPRTLALLADADAFASLGLTRREALWQVRRSAARRRCRSSPGSRGRGRKTR